MKTLFLDFDGVLHPEFSHPSNYFCCLSHFEKAIRRAPDWEIVIASTWRRNHPMSDLLRPFSPDVAVRIIGVTPEINEISDVPDSLLGYAREAECQAWMRANGRWNLPWIALDDSAWLYRPFSRHLLPIDGCKGMQESDAGVLVRRLLDEH